MLHVDLHNILTEEDALQKIRDIFDKVEQQKETFVVTKNGRPVFAIVDIETLEKTEAAPVIEPPLAPTVPQPEVEIQTIQPMPVPEMQAPVELAMPSFPEPTPIAVTTTPVSTFSPLPPLQGMPELPDMPEDPSNNSPLA